MTPVRRAVLVVGPRVSGAGGVAAALARELPEYVVHEGACPAGPDAVVAVFSAVAPLTPSDWTIVERASARTELVLGVVSKIDAHRGWRTVLDEDRATVAALSPRWAEVPWLGVAAAPDVGPSEVGALVTLLRAELADPSMDRRNVLRRSAVRNDRPSVDLRGVRLRLLRLVRDRCAEMRAEFRAAAATMPPGGAGRFEQMVRDRGGEFLDDLDAELALSVGGAGAVVANPPELATTPAASRRLETRLMAVLGAGFGLGVALASSRVLAGVAPGASVAGLIVGGTLGLLLTAWVVRTRGLLHDRALLERWAVEVCGALRWHGEALIAERLLKSESTFSRSEGPP